MERLCIRRRRQPGVRDLEGIHPLLARIYAARNVTETDELRTDLSRLIPVGSLGGCERAVELLLEHREQASRVLVIGDFDADGATSSALVCRALGRMGFVDVDYLVPNRFEFGYGLSRPLVEVARDRSPGLIVTVDNGVSSVDGVAAARAAGIDVIVTDHHLPPDRLPDANAIVNPNLQDEAFPSKNLAGVGVAFYLMAALARRLMPRQEAGSVIASLLDLVALGTVADVVPFDHNNRILVEQGLLRIRAGRCCPGILALMRDGNRDPGRTVSSDLAFCVGPRLNAAGRLDDMSIGIRCLLTDSHSEAGRHAAVLGQLNEERRSIEHTMQNQALEAVESLSLGDPRNLPGVLCLFDQGWHQGVVGLVASRVKERVHRPVLAFAADGETGLKGSARSIPGLHIRDALAEVDARHPGLIRRFGGHAMAAGLTLDAADLQRFDGLLRRVVDKRLDPAALTREILTDGGLDDEYLNLGTAELLRMAGPWGQAFPEPLFDDEFLVADIRVMRERHLRFRARRPHGRTTIDAVAFNQAERLRGHRPDRLRLVYRLDVNDFRGIRSPQLLVQHLEAVEPRSAAAGP
jgi:single-stranded-DNA-specific exonuclease